LDTFEQNKQNASSNLFAMAVGIKQKDLVDKMVKKVTSEVFSTECSLVIFSFFICIERWLILTQIAVSSK